MKWMSLLIVFVFSVACSNASFESKLASHGSDTGVDVPNPVDTGLGDDDPRDPSDPGNPSDPVTNPPDDRVYVDPELGDNPDLPRILDMFPCPGETSDNVYICHFPEGSNGGHAQCIGRPALSSHYDHFQGATGESDYLGPCQ